MNDKPVNRDFYYKNVMLKWYDFIVQEKDISYWFVNNEISEICIWGLGDIGKRVFEALSKKVSILAIVESKPKQSSYKNTKVICVDELKTILDSIDAIVVIPGYDIESIEEKVPKHGREKIITIDNLFQPNVKKDMCDIELERFGGDYGGYYCASEMISQGAIVYSFGVGEDISFEHDIQSKYNAKIFVFDPTPKAQAFLARREKLNGSEFEFYDYGISDKNQVAEFYLPENKEYVSGSTMMRDGLEQKSILVEMKDIYTIAKELGHKHIDVLKLDIEGSEFVVVDGLKECEELVIDQICLETHQRFFDNSIDMIEQMNNKLHELGYVLVYLSDNMDEFSYIRSEIV